MNLLTVDGAVPTLVRARTLGGDTLTTATFAAPRIELERRSDGTSVLRSTAALPVAPTTLGHAFARHAAASPDRLPILSDNSTAHLLLTLAALRVGAPVVTTSVAYSNARSVIGAARGSASCSPTRSDQPSSSGASGRANLQERPTHD